MILPFGESRTPGVVGRVRVASNACRQMVCCRRVLPCCVVSVGRLRYAGRACAGPLSKGTRGAHGWFRRRHDRSRCEPSE